MKNKLPMATTNIALLLEKTFLGPAWHGPSVLEALDNISEPVAFRKGTETHSIIELVAHMTAWRNFDTQRLNGDAAYEVSDAENFPFTTNWAEAQNNLKES